LRSGIVLEKVCEYLYYNEKNKDARDVPELEYGFKIVRSDVRLISHRFPTELCLELLMAADYLDI
jgi:elongin-C